MRIGLIGPGSFAMRGVVPAMALVDGIELAATWARREEAARQVADQHGGVVCRTIEEICSRGDVDALFVVTPPGAHAALLPIVISSGKPFICDKPVARSSRELAPLVESVEARGTLHAVNHQFRYVPEMVAIADLVRSGAIGRVHMSTYNLLAGFSLDPRMAATQKYWSFHHSAGEGGGLLPQVVSHHIDLQRMVLGNLAAAGGALSTIVAEKMTAPATPGGPDGPAKAVEVEDCAAVSARLPDGGLAAMSFSSVVTSMPDLRWLIHGDKGSIAYHGRDGFFGGQVMLSQGWMGEPQTVALPEQPDRDLGMWMRDMIVELLVDFRAVLEGKREHGRFAKLADELAVWHMIDSWRANGK